MELQAPYWNIILLGTLLPAICFTGVVPHLELDDRHPGVAAPEDSVTESSGEEDLLSQRQVRYTVSFILWFLQCERSTLGANKQQWRENFNFNEPLLLNVILLHCDGKFSFIFHVFNIQARAKGSLMVCAWKNGAANFMVKKPWFANDYLFLNVWKQDACRKAKGNHLDLNVAKCCILVLLVYYKRDLN